MAVCKCQIRIYKNNTPNPGPRGRGSALTHGDGRSPNSSFFGSTENAKITMKLLVSLAWEVLGTRKRFTTRGKAFHLRAASPKSRHLLKNPWKISATELFVCLCFQWNIICMVISQPPRIKPESCCRPECELLGVCAGSSWSRLLAGDGTWRRWGCPVPTTAP